MPTRDIHGHLPPHRACQSCGVGPRKRLVTLAAGLAPLWLCDDCAPRKQEGKK